MLVLLPNGYHVCLRDCLHECVEGNGPLGLEVDQGALYVWEQHREVWSASCMAVAQGALAVLALDSRKARPAPDG
jgi:hypothetical protein